MKHISESIIGRRGSGLPVLRKIKNPRYSDLVPYNIIEVTDAKGSSRYGIIISEDDNHNIFGMNVYKSHYVIFYTPWISPKGNLEYLTIKSYLSSFPKSEWTPLYDIVGIWDGSLCEEYFKDICRDPKKLEDFLRPALENPEKFKRMLKP